MSGARQFVCGDCNKSLANAKTFRAHLLTKTHKMKQEQKICGRPDLQALSLEDFRERFGDRLFRDLLSSSHDVDDRVFDINEIVPWLGIHDPELVIRLVGKIFHENIERCESDPLYRRKSFGLNQFKKLLITANTEQSGKSLEYLKALRIEYNERPTIHSQKHTDCHKF
jgi:hypothetical protein